MTVWFLTNLLLTLCALVFMIVNGNSPHRLRFHAGFIALTCWLVPWPALSGLIPNPGVALPFENHARSLLDLDLPSAPSSSLSILSQILFLAATAIGVLLFAFTLYRHFQLLHGMRASARVWRPRRTDLRESIRQPNVPALYLQDVLPGAITTGIFKPVIWVNSALATDPDLRAIVLHECTHIRHHDNIYLWLITFAEKIFWWNPLVRLLASRTRELQELSCDEACADAHPRYRDMLSRLILQLSKEESDVATMPFNAGMFRNKSFNVYRIQILKRKYPMNIKHYVSTVALVCCTALPIGWVIAQPDGPTAAEARLRMLQVEAEQRHIDAQARDEARRTAAQTEAVARQNAARAGEEARRAAVTAQAGAQSNQIRDPQTGMTQTQILDGMKVYTANLEAAYLELQEAKAALEQDLERLRADVLELQTRIR